MRRTAACTTFAVAVVVMLCPGPARAVSPTSRRVDGIPITANAIATPLIRRGLDAADDGENPGQWFDAALASDPSSVTAQFLAGTLLPTIDAKNAAMDAALERAGKLPEPERLALQYVAARLRFNVSEQVRISALLVRLVPASAIAHGFRGEALQLSGDTDGAEREYRRVLALDPSKASATAALGYAALGRDDTATAASLFERFASLRPASPRPHDALGEAMLRDGRFDDAIVEFTKASDADQHFAMGHEGEAVARFYKGDRVGALAAMKTYIDRSDDKGGADIGLAQLELALGDASAADRALDDAITHRPGDQYWTALIGVFRGSLREYAGRHADAIAILEPLRAAITGLRVPPSQMQGLEILRLQWLAMAQGSLGRTADAKGSAVAAGTIAAASPADKVRADQAAIAAWAAAMSAHDAKAALRAVAHCQFCRAARATALELAGRTEEAAAERAYLATHFSRDPESALTWTTRRR